MISIVLFGLLSTSAFAAPVNAQISVSAQSSLKLGKSNWDLGAFGSVLVLSGADPISFVYAGPGVQVTPWWWTTVRTGFTIGLPEGGAAPLGSWWNAFGSDSSTVAAFTEVDVYWAEGDAMWYGYASADYRAHRLSIGPQVEYFNVITAGPHVGLKFSDQSSLGLETYWGNGGATTLRAKTGFSF